MSVESTTTERIVNNLNNAYYLAINPNDSEYLYCTVGTNQVIQISTQTNNYVTYVNNILGLEGIAFDNNNNLYCCQSTGASIIKIDQNNNRSTLCSFTVPQSTLRDLLFYNGYLYCVLFSFNPQSTIIFKIDISNGEYTPFYTFNNAYSYGITVDNNGNFYVSNQQLQQVIKILADGSDSSVYTSNFYGYGVYFYENILYGCSFFDSKVLQLNSDGTVTTFLEGNDIYKPAYLVFSNPRTFYISNDGNYITKTTINTVIEVAPVFGKLIDSSPFPLDATSTSTEQIFYQSSNLNVATVNSLGVVTITGVGESTITLTQYFGNVVDASATTLIIVSDNNYILTNVFPTNNSLRGIALDNNDDDIIYACLITDGNISKMNIHERSATAYAEYSTSITIDNSNFLYGNMYNNQIRKFTPTDVPTGTSIAITTAFNIVYDKVNNNLYVGAINNIKMIDMNGTLTTFASSQLFSQVLGIAIDEETNDVYVANISSDIFKIVKDPNTNDTIITTITNIPNIRALVFKDNVLYCTTSGNNIYQIILIKNNEPIVREWFSSSLLNDTYCIINGPQEDNNNVFYVSSNSVGIVKILANSEIDISSTISVNSVFNKEIGDNPFNLNATSNNPSPIFYSSTNTNIAVVDDNGLVTIKNLGNCKIIMSQNAYHDPYVDNNFYYSACSAESDINVNSPTISVASVFNKILNDSQFNLNATSNSSLQINYVSSNTNVVTIGLTSGIATIKNVGTSTITLKQYYQDVEVSSATTTINVYNQPFGNVTAMNYDFTKNLLYVSSNNEYPYNLITIANNGVSTSLNIPTTDAVIECINSNEKLYLGGSFNSLSGNKYNKNIAQLEDENISYSSIELYVNNMLVDNVENNQTIGVTTTNNGVPFEINKT